MAISNRRKLVFRIILVSASIALLLRDHGIALKSAVIAGYLEKYLRGKWGMAPGQGLKPNQVLDDVVE